MKHLAIFDGGEVIENILKGEKVIDSRFSRKKSLPYGQIKKGDEIYLKMSGEKIVGRVNVDNVLFYDNLTPEMLGKIRKEYDMELKMAEDFWKKVSKSKFVSLIFLKNPHRFVSPIKYTKHDRRSWVILKS